MSISHLNPSPLNAIFQLLRISFILLLASLFLYRNILPYCSDFCNKLYNFNTPLHPPEPPIDPDIVLDCI